MPTEGVYITARLSKIRVRARFYRKMLASCNEKDARSRDPRITNTRSAGEWRGEIVKAWSELTERSGRTTRWG